MSTYESVECARACIKNDVSCPNGECRKWIDYEEDLNCCLIATAKHGPLSLRECAKRLGISFVAVKFIEQQALKKINKRGIFKEESQMSG